jgi:hypothetical protein
MWSLFDDPLTDLLIHVWLYNNKIQNKHISDLNPFPDMGYTIETSEWMIVV